MVKLLADDEGTVKILSKSYPTKKQAIISSHAELQRLPRGRAEFKLTLSIGRPEIITEKPVNICGYKKQIDS